MYNDDMKVYSKYEIQSRPNNGTKILNSEYRAYGLPDFLLSFTVSMLIAE